MTGQQHDLEKLPQYIEQLKANTPAYLAEFEERKYKPSELGISARNINNWSDNGLLPPIKKKGPSGWRKEAFSNNIFSEDEFFWNRPIEVKNEVHFGMHQHKPFQRFKRKTPYSFQFVGDK